jgi:3-oxoacyl-[acyl-carrier-protein] synthase II
MNAPPRILAASVVDAQGIACTGGWSAAWRALGVEAPGNGLSFRALFQKSDATFRRLDRMTRAIVVAAEACAIEAHLSEAEREATGLVVETARGSVEVDLGYTRALADGVVRAAFFPYTLQSTCLGDVALRHGLRGPTLSLSVGEGEEGEALREARRMFARNGLRHALIGVVDALGEALPGVDPVLRAVACLAAAPGTEAPSVVPWPEGEAAPFAALAAACRRAATHARAWSEPPGRVDDEAGDPTGQRR